MIPVAYASNGFQETARHVLSTRKLTRAHQAYFMKAALSSHSLSDDELATLDRLFDALQRGFVRVVD